MIGKIKRFVKKLMPVGIGLGTTIAIYAAILLTFTSIIYLVADISNTPPGTDDSEHGQEQPSYNGVFFNQLHEQLFQLDMSKIPDDAPLNVAQDTVTLKGWTLKDYLNAYMLACEICARSEINPDLSQPDIYPEDLLGSWFMEATCNPGISVFDQRQYSYCRYIDVVSSSGDFIGPFQQNKVWSQVGTPDNTYMMGVYISWQENPDIQPGERAYMGTPTMLAESRGFVMTGESYQTLLSEGKTPMAQTYSNKAEVTSSVIRWGSLASGDTTSSRPNSKYLPDAMYTNAIHMRLALDGRNPIFNKTDSHGYGNAALDPLLSGLDHKSALAPRKALTKDINSANYAFLDASSDYNSCGAAAKLYVASALNPDTTFYYVDKIPKDRVRQYMTGGGNLYQILYGQGNTAAKKDHTVLSATDSLLYQLENGSPYKFSRAEAQAARDQFGSKNGGAIFSQIYYGFTNSQAGHVIVATMESIAQVAAQNQDWKYDTPQLAPGESPDDSSQGNSGTPGTPVDTSVCTGNPNCAHNINGQVWGKFGWPSNYSAPIPQEIPGTFQLGSLGFPYDHCTTGRTDRYVSYGGHKFNMDFSRNLVAPGDTVYVTAISDGVVVSIVANSVHGGSGRSSWGNVVVVAHPGGYLSTYGHMESFAHIYPGMFVSKGTVLGVMGNTGNSSGVHVHLEISDKARSLSGFMFPDTSKAHGVAPGFAYPGIRPANYTAGFPFLSGVDAFTYF